LTKGIVRSIILLIQATDYENRKCLIMTYGFQ